MHEYGPVITTFIVVLAGVLFNRKDVSDLKSDMNRQYSDLRSDMSRQYSDLRSDMSRQFDEVKAHLTRIDADLKEFHGKDRELEGRLNELSARIK